MKLRFILVLLVVANMPTPIYSQLGGSSTYTFLKMPNTARVEALGGMAISLFDDDLGLALQNPSLLNKSMHNQLVMSYNNYFANIGYGYASYARHWDKIGTFYAGMQFLNYGDFTRTDEFGNILGTFSAGDYCLNIGYSRPFFDSLLYVGSTFKMIYSQYAEYNSFGMALDLGASYISRNKLFTASVVLRNMGGQIDPYTPGNHEAPPFEIHAGISQGFKHVPLRLMLWVTNLQRPDLSHTNPEDRFQVDPLTNDTIDTKIGIGTNILRHFTIAAELSPFKKHLFLRVAYNFQRGGEMKVDAKGGGVGLSYGVGVKIKNFTISYSRSHYFITESPNHFTLNIDLNGFHKWKRKPKTDQPPM